MPECYSSGHENRRVRSLAIRSKNVDSILLLDHSRVDSACETIDSAVSCRIRVFTEPTERSLLVLRVRVDIHKHTNLEPNL